MIKKAIRIKLLDGYQELYKKRHDELWPEMVDMLSQHGVQSYEIYLDPKTNDLFGILEITDEKLWAQASRTKVNQKWWAFMEDIMETNPDSSPVSVSLLNVFRLEEHRKNK